jgi:O-antigen/teichoic acid export membrane protein
MTIRQLYLRSGLFSLGGKLVTSFAALGVIWLITRIAGKDIFGEIMIAYAFNFVIAAALAAQFQTIILYHVSRDHEKNLHRDRLGAALFYALMIGFVIVVLEKMFAGQLAALMHKENLTIWFSSLSWMIPAYALNSILSTWYRARQDIPTMVMHFEVWPNIFRLIFLCVVLLVMKDPAWIATAYAASYALSFFLLYVRDPVPLNANFLFTKWDMTYSAQMMAGHMMSKSLNNIVVLFLGMFTPAAVVADYTLAMKFAQFLDLPRLIMNQVQMPRMGAQIKNRQTAAMMAEFEAVRSLTLAGTLLGTALFLLLLPYVFALFGDFAGAYNLFVWLAVSAIVFAGFGGAANYLGIAGHSAAAMMVHAAAFSVLLVALIALVPAYGGAGAAIATIVGTIGLVTATSFAILRKGRLNTMTMSAALQIAAASCAIILTATHIISAPVAALMLIAVAALGLLESRPALRLLLPF